MLYTEILILNMSLYDPHPCFKVLFKLT